jgi:hypothetical protein
MDLLIPILALLASLASLGVSLYKKRKPSLAAAVQRGVLYGKAQQGTREEKIRHACFAVIREDTGDNGKRDWPDARIRQEVEAHFAV